MVGPLAADAWAATLAADGQLDKARAVRADAVPLRGDFFHSIFATLRAAAVIAVADRAEAEVLAADLARTPRLLAGAASAALAMQPVALTLGELMAFLGRREEAAGYFAIAEQVAVRWNSPQWTARALAAL